MDGDLGVIVLCFLRGVFVLIKFIKFCEYDLFIWIWRLFFNIEIVI